LLFHEILLFLGARDLEGENGSFACAASSRVVQQELLLETINRDALSFKLVHKANYCGFIDILGTPVILFKIALVLSLLLLGDDSDTQNFMDMELIVRTLEEDPVIQDRGLETDRLGGDHAPNGGSCVESVFDAA
jgi:hypothetical protein